ncbi:MAG: cytochrome P450 [Pseudoruegeria sp.]
MTAQTLPVFDASSEFHQNVGLLKVAEMAMRKHGNAVVIRASDVRDMVLLTSTEAVKYWKSHQGHFLTEMGEIASNAAITQIILGDALEQPENAAAWDSTRKALGVVNRNWDKWSERSLVMATNKLLGDIALAGPAVDLRGLCSIWSVRALVPTLFGDSLPDVEMREGLMQIEQFYYAMSTQDAQDTNVPSDMPEFIVARDFLDRATGQAMDNIKAEDETVIAVAHAALPADMSRETKIDCLRPTLGRLLLEKLNIDGLALLWALTHIAQDEALADDMVAELQGSDPFITPDLETPLSFSVVQECLRMYPELPFIYRITSQPVELFGYKIPERTTVVFAPWLVQRDPQYWENPNSFDGKRFLCPPTDKSAYLPFGIGPRVRTRTSFLQHQLSVAVRAVMQNFSVQLAADTKRGNIRPILRSTLAPRGEVSVRFTQRDEIDALNHTSSQE